MVGSEKIRILCAWLLGGLFLYAGGLKLLRPDLLLTDIVSYQLVSYRFAYVVSYILPAVEILAGGALFFRSRRVFAASLLFALTFVFILALGSAWARGLDISCGCFGKSASKANYPWLIGRDVVLLLMSLYIVRPNWRSVLRRNAGNVGPR